MKRDLFPSNLPLHCARMSIKILFVELLISYKIQRLFRISEEAFGSAPIVSIYEKMKTFFCYETKHTLSCKTFQEMLFSHRKYFLFFIFKFAYRHGTAMKSSKEYKIGWQEGKVRREYFEHAWKIELNPKLLGLW